VISVDTNVLVRILIDDPGAAEQMLAARSLLETYGILYVPQIVQVEVVWVLESAYHFDKLAIGTVLEHLQNHPQFHLQSPECFNVAVSLFRQHSADFSDCLILAESSRNQLRLATFDKKLGRIKGVERIKA